MPTDLDAMPAIEHWARLAILRPNSTSRLGLNRVKCLHPVGLVPLRRRSFLNVPDSQSDEDEEDAHQDRHGSDAKSDHGRE